MIITFDSSTIILEREWKRDKKSTPFTIGKQKCTNHIKCNKDKNNRDMFCEIDPKWFIIRAEERKKSIQSIQSTSGPNPCNTLQRI